MFDLENLTTEKYALLAVILLLICLFIYRYLSRKKPNDNSQTSNTIDNTKISAIKTVERAGEPIITEGLNFDSFGKSSIKDKNDLKKIKGVGPVLEKKLNGVGIYTFAQIAAFSEQDILDLTKLIAFPKGKIVRDNWLEQANNLK